MADTNLTDWLLETKIHSIRYLTMRHLLDKAEDDPDVQSIIRQQMAATGPIPQILAQQTDAGRWQGEHSYYTPKYTSTHWSMMLLAELDVDADDQRFQKGIEFMLSDTEERMEKALKSGEEYGLLCFWGNMLRYVFHGNKFDDPRIETIIHYIERDALRKEWRCPYNDGLPCSWGVARTLWGLAFLPDEYRTPLIRQVIENGLTFLMESYQLVEADYPFKGKISKLWSKLNFPLFYQTDILFVLRVLKDFDALDHPGAKPALAWLEARRKANGRWQGASPYGSRTWDGMRIDKQDTSRWVSLHAAMILK
jgi:hypothetical protein